MAFVRQNAYLAMYRKQSWASGEDERKTDKGGALLAMEKEIKLITEPQELMKWMAEHDVLMDLSKEDIQLLLDYMEGHDYAMGIAPEGQLVRVDMSLPEPEYTEYSLDDFIDLACEWNYEFILEADKVRNNPKDMIEFANAQSRYESCKRDEERFDRMFDQTKYKVQIDELAEKLANEFIKNMGTDIEKAANKVADGIREYKEERVR